MNSNKKLIILLIFLSFFFVYLEWGGNNSGFIFQMTYSILFSEKIFSSYTHPFIFLPLIGLLLLLFTLFQNQPRRWMTITGIVLSGVLVYFIFIIGLLSLNWKILLSSFPFVALSLYYLFTPATRSHNNTL